MCPRHSICLARSHALIVSSQKLRWEKYAPGPVQLVAAKAAKRHAPKAAEAKKKARTCAEVPPVPLPEPAAEDVLPETDLAIVIPNVEDLGCPKCRHASLGCLQCHDLGYRHRRVARAKAKAAEQAAAKANTKAKATAKASTACAAGKAKAKAATGRGRGRGRGRAPVSG